MVRAIENWAELTGTVREVRPRPGVPQMSEMVLDVDGSEDVEGYPNLLGDAAGQELAVSVKKEDLDAVEPGARVRFHARRADPETVVARPQSLARD